MPDMTKTNDVPVTTPDHEKAGWQWLECLVESICDEDAADITYSADQMVDAYMAGAARHRLATQPDAQSDGVGEAVLAERERCALIAETYDGPRVSASKLRAAIAATLRNQTKGSTDE